MNPQITPVKSVSPLLNALRSSLREFHGGKALGIELATDPPQYHLPELQGGVKMLEWHIQRALNFFLLCHSREACPRPDRGAGIYEAFDMTGFLPTRE